MEGALGAEGGLPADDDTKDYNADSDGYIDVDTDEFSDTASISSGASTGSVGECLLMLFVYKILRGLYLLFQHHYCDFRN